MTAADYPPETRVDPAGRVWERFPDGKWRALLTGAVSPTPKFTAPEWSDK